jgi:hypothetical protein
MGCTTLAREGVGEAVREGDAPTDKLGAADGATLMVADCDAAAPELHEMIDGVGCPLEPGEAVHASCATEVEKGAPMHAVPRKMLVVSAVLLQVASEYCGSAPPAICTHAPSGWATTVEGA